MLVTISFQRYRQGLELATVALLQVEQLIKSLSYFTSLPRQHVIS